MALELEFKTQVASHEPIRRILRRVGARRQGRVLEINSHFDTSDQALLRRRSGLRIRRLAHIDSRKPRNAATITFKGPLKKGPFKAREEIESAIDRPDELIRLLENLGYRERLRFEKRRESWILPARRGRKGCKVELDEIPLLGCFVEIEGPAIGVIRSALKLLELGDAQPLQVSYAGLLAASRVNRQARRGPLIFKFN